jgi:polysaccharide export outer membrane protein
MKTFVLGVLISCVVLAGCAGKPSLGGNPALTVVQGNELPEPTTSDISQQARAYLVGPFDRLAIDVYGAEELKRTIQVDAAGRVSLPLVGVIQASGSTPQQLEEEIENRLRGKYMRDPQVTVNLTETISQVVTVQGEVDEPGMYPVIGRMTLMRAVARAKGTTDLARLSHVVVFRDVKGQQMAALYDLRAIQQGAYADPEIFANDIVVVGQSTSRRLFKDLIQGSGLILTPIVGLMRP